MVTRYHVSSLQEVPQPSLSRFRAQCSAKLLCSYLKPKKVHGYLCYGPHAQGTSTAAVGKVEGERCGPQDGKRRVKQAGENSGN